MASIYMLTCRPNLKAYVGCTANIAKRMREHRCLLRKGKHGCIDLQFAWEYWGEGAFFMREVEKLPDDAPVSLKRERELHWMSYLQSCKRLFNDKIISFRGPPGSIEKAQLVAHLSPGRRWTPEANEKRRKAQLGKPKGHGAKISATKRAKSMMR